MVVVSADEKGASGVDPTAPPPPTFLFFLFPYPL